MCSTHHTVSNQNFKILCNAGDIISILYKVNLYFIVRFLFAIPNNGDNIWQYFKSIIAISSDIYLLLSSILADVGATPVLTSEEVILHDDADDDDENSFCS